MLAYRGSDTDTTILAVGVDLTVLVVGRVWLIVLLRAR